MDNTVKINTLHLFPVLDKLLIELLSDLTLEEWNTQTIAKLWTVKDIAAHLLDGNLRGLSTSRDGYFGMPPNNVNSYEDLIAYLNELNKIWTDAAKRLSPQVLIHLLELTGQQYSTHLKTLPPFENAIFPVAWAGQATSPNWFHVAREYTEKYLHQQQIRDALGREGLLTKTLFLPFINTLMYAFPHTFRAVDAKVGTIVSLTISGEVGGRWDIVKTDKNWALDETLSHSTDAIVEMTPEIAWKLFSKSWKAEEVLDKVKIIGDQRLGKQVLNIVGVMA